MARLTLEAGATNRVEFRSAGADCNPYIAIAGVLAAGCDGLERNLALGPMAEGDMYTNPSDSPVLPSDMRAAIDAFAASALAAMLGTKFSENYVVLAENELAAAAPHLGDDRDVVSNWEWQRYREHL